MENQLENQKERLLGYVDSCVSAGIRSYVGLICCGELERSRRLLSDSLQLSALASGGPSARGQGRSLSLLTVRNILATLLVLRATGYWRKVAALEELQDRCATVVSHLDEEAGTGDGCASGRTGRCGLNGCNCAKTDGDIGCRRNDALPSESELCCAGKQLELPELPAPEHRHNGRMFINRTI